MSKASARVQRPLLHRYHVHDGRQRHRALHFRNMTWMEFLVGSSRLCWASWHSLVFAYAGYNRFQSHKPGGSGNQHCTTDHDCPRRLLAGRRRLHELHDGERSVDDYRRDVPDGNGSQHHAARFLGHAMTLSSANSGSQGVIQFGGGGARTAKQCVSAALGLKDCRLYGHLPVRSSARAGSSGEMSWVT